MRGIRSCLAVALACASGFTCAGDAHAGIAAEGIAYEGIAYKPGTQRVLYRESHWQVGKQHLVLYRCPDGRAFARKRLDYARGALAPDYEVFDARDGYRSGVVTESGGREAFMREDAGQPRRSAALAAGTVVDAGFDAFIRQAWDRFASEAAVEMPFLVPGRLRTMRFRLQARPASTPDRRMFRLSLASWVGGVLPHVDVTYDAATRTLLRFQGLSDVRDGRGGNVTADIRFPPQRRRTTDAAALRSAGTVALDGACRQ